MSKFLLLHITPCLTMPTWRNHIPSSLWGPGVAFGTVHFNTAVRVELHEGSSYSCTYDRLSISALHLPKNTDSSRYHTSGSIIFIPLLSNSTERSCLQDDAARTWAYSMAHVLPFAATLRHYFQLTRTISPWLVSARNSSVSTLWIVKRWDVCWHNCT